MGRTTIYAAMTGGFGSLAQVLPVLEQLPADEYRIVCSISRGAAVGIQNLGFEFIAYPEVDKPNPALVTPAGREWRDLDHYWGRFGFGDPQYFAAIIESRLRILDRLKPDLLLTQFCPPTETLARVTGIPLVCFTQSCWHPRGRSVSWWDATRPAPEYVRVTPSVNAVLSAHGADPIARMEDLNTGALTLIPSFEEFDPIDDPTVHYIGPVVWTSSARLASPVAVVRAPTRPVVAAYTGHLHDSGGRSGALILEQVTEALRDTDIDVVVATGLGERVDPSIRPAANVLVREWIDVPELLGAASLFIHHGGHGSCMACILGGTPALVIPTFQEREYNARQLASLGVGSFVKPDELTPASLRAAVFDQLADQRTRRKVQQWRTELARRRYPGPAGAAALIRGLRGPAAKPAPLAVE